MTLVAWDMNDSWTCSSRILQPKGLIASRRIDYAESLTRPHISEDAEETYFLDR